MDAGWKQIALEECQLHPLKCVGEGTSSFVVVARLGKSTSPMIPARQTRGQTSATSSQLCALKVFKSKSNVVLQVAKREAHILARLHGHPNIIRISGAFKTARGRPILVMEFCSRSLQGVLDQHPRGLAAPAVKLLIWQLLQVLRYMHKRNYMHRDLKPSNLLLTDEGVVKLCDFGLARQVPRARSSKDMKKASSGSKQGDCGSTAEQYDNDQQPGFDTSRTAPEEYTAARNGQLTPYVVTRWYRAPEILLGQPYGTASDIWSLGCTIAELASGSPLLPGSSTVDQIFHIWRMFRSLPSKNKPPGYACPVAPNRQPPTVTERREDQQFPLAFQPLQQAQQQSQSQAQPPQQEQWQPQRSIRHHRQLGTQLEGPLLDVLDAMLQTDPRDRPTAEELLNMPYFFNISEVITGTVMEHLYGKLNSASRSGSANNIDTGATIKKARGNEETASETAATTATAEGSLPYGQPYKAVVCNTASSAVLAAAADQQWADKGQKVKGPKRMKMREVVKIGALLAASSQLLSRVQQTDVQLSGVVPACDDLGDRLVNSASLPGDGSRCRPATNPAPLFEQDREVEEDYDVTLPPPPPPPPRTAVAMSCGLGPETALGGARDPAGCRVGDAAAAAVRSDAPPGVQPATIDELMNPPHVSGSEGPDSGSDCCDARGDLITQFTCGPSYQISNGAAACEAQHQEQQQRRQNFVQRILDFIHQYGSPELGPLHAGDGYQGCDLHAAERAKLQQQSVQASKDTFYVAPAALPQAPCSDPTSLPSILPAALQQVMADEPGREQVPAAANVAEVAKLPTAADKTKTAGRSLRSVTPVNVSLSVSSLGLATVTTAVARTASKGLRSLSSTQERNQSQTAVSEVKVNWLSVPGTSMLSSTVDSEMKSPVADVGCLTGCWGRRGSAGKAAN